jgi:hypothetical protein
MRHTLSIFSFLILVLFFSCTKDQIHPNTNYVVFGNSAASFMDIVTFDPKMQIASWANGGHVYDSIDLDKNGSHDINFISFGQKWANTSNCAIASLNDSVEILVEVIQDSLFLTYNNQNPLINHPKVKWNTFSGFESFSDNDSLYYMREVYFVRMFNYGDTLDISEENHVWVTNGNFTGYSQGFSYDSDFYLHYRLGFWNDEGEKYLCYRRRNGSVTKYGWIKASIEYNITINVYEYSISD